MEEWVLEETTRAYFQSLLNLKMVMCWQSTLVDMAEHTEIRQLPKLDLNDDDEESDDGFDLMNMDLKKRGMDYGFWLRSYFYAYVVILIL